MDFVAGLVREKIILIIPQNTTEGLGQEIVVYRFTGFSQR